MAKRTAAQTQDFCVVLALTILGSVLGALINVRRQPCPRR
jgi:membrane protein YqaA with SNARE-associated domain